MCIGRRVVEVCDKEPLLKVGDYQENTRVRHHKEAVSFRLNISRFLHAFVVVLLKIK